MKSAVFATALLATCAFSEHARACGGCFHRENQTTESVVTGHRMVFALSEKRTVLWDQIKYTGAPEEFAWVLPIRPGAYIESSTDGWFEVLEAVTGTSVAPPQIQCTYPSFNGYGSDYGGSSHGCGCSSEDSSAAAPGSRFVGGDAGASSVPPPVQVVHQGTVGPYDTVTLSSKDANALRNWLTKNGFAIPPDIDPIIDMYVSEGADFIALKLRPGAGVNAMTPVRVVTPNGPGILPLRMVAAGTGAYVDIVLYVIGESRYGLVDLTETQIDLSKLSYDLTNNTSNYATLRQDALAENLGASYLSTFAVNGAFSAIFSNISIAPLFGGDIPSLYFTQCNLDEGKSSVLPASCSTAGFSSDKLVVETRKAEPPDAGRATDAGTRHDAGRIANEAGSEAGGSLKTADASRLATDAAPTVGDAATPATDASKAPKPSPTGTPLPPTEIGSTDLTCQNHSDIAAALIGMHPKRVWLTRLEMNLPHEDLTMDCHVEPSSSTAQITNPIVAQKYTGDPCPGGTVAAGSTTASIAVFPRAGGILTLLALLLHRRKDRSRRGAPVTIG